MRGCSERKSGDDAVTLALRDSSLQPVLRVFEARLARIAPDPSRNALLPGLSGVADCVLIGAIISEISKTIVRLAKLAPVERKVRIPPQTSDHLHILFSLCLLALWVRKTSPQLGCGSHDPDRDQG